MNALGLCAFVKALLLLATSTSPRNCCRTFFLTTYAFCTERTLVMRHGGRGATDVFNDDSNAPHFQSCA